MDVRTRGGIFGSGGYGGGVFDGSMAVGGLGATGRGAGFEQAAAGLGIVRQASAGFGAVPTPSAKDSRVSALQNALNEQLAHYNCTTRLTVDGLIATYSGQSKTCGALVWVEGAQGSQFNLDADIRTACARYTAVAPSCPAPPAPPPPPSGGTTPSGSPQVSEAQQKLNQARYVLGLQPIALTGQVNLEFCGAVYELNQKIATERASDFAGLSEAAWQYVQGWIDYWGRYGSGMATSCQSVAPTPTPPVGPTADLGPSYANVLAVQKALNPVLYVLGYEPISENGRLDDVLCGAVDVANLKLVQLQQSDFQGVPAGAFAPMQAWLEGWKQAGAIITAWCGSMGRTAPTVHQGMPSAEPCMPKFGESSAFVSEFQGYLNQQLVTNGYEPVPVTGTWDAATCGGVYVLHGEFGDFVSKSCGADWVVPIQCPTKTLPKRPDEKKKISRAAAWTIGGILAAALAGGTWFAAKKAGA